MKKLVPFAAGVGIFLVLVVMVSHKSSSSILFHFLFFVGVAFFIKRAWDVAMIDHVTGRRLSAYKLSDLVRSTRSGVPVRNLEKLAICRP